MDHFAVIEKCKKWKIKKTCMGLVVARYGNAIYQVRPSFENVAV